MAADVHYSPSVAIRVRYIGPSNTRGSRFRVWRADDVWANDPDRIEVPFAHEYSHGERASRCVEQYLAKKDERSGWDGRWVVAGASGSEYIAVKVGA